MPASVAEQKAADTTSLCQRCESIDIESLYSLNARSMDVSGKKVYEFASQENHLVENPSCPLCQIFGELSSQWQYWNAHRPEILFACHLRAIPCRTIYQRVLPRRYDVRKLRNDPNLVQPVSVESQHVLLYLANAITTNEEHTGCESAIDFNTVIARRELKASGSASELNQEAKYAPQLTATVEYKLQNPSAIICDWTLFRAWIYDCRTNHVNCLKSTQSLRPVKHQIFVIDVRNRKVVPLPTGCDFTALSYVWGKGRSTVRRDSHGVIYYAPQTIEDGMHATLMLDQQNTDVKAQQIQGMADIFETATVVLVALGKDADVGLYGVTTARRQPKPILRTSSHEYLTAYPPVQIAIEQSAWSTRGWTYQEHELSRRSLFFGPQQVYFVCRCHSQCEALSTVVIPNQDSSTTRTDEPETIAYDGITRPYTFASTTFNERRSIYKHITDYSLRSLAFPSDALNAFMGLLRRESETMTFWGIPCSKYAMIFLSQTSTTRKMLREGFCLGLTWMNTHSSGNASSKKCDRYVAGNDCVEFSTKGRRRHEFPSWSWLSSPSPVWTAQVLMAGMYQVYAANIALRRYDGSWSPMEYNDCDQFATTRTNLGNTRPSSSTHALAVHTHLRMWKLYTSVGYEKPDIIARPQPAIVFFEHQHDDAHLSGDQRISFDFDVKDDYQTGDTFEALLMTVESSKAFSSTISRWLIVRVANGVARRIGHMSLNLHQYKQPLIPVDEIENWCLGLPKSTYVLA